jgi:hypothetical protein
MNTGYRSHPEGVEPQGIPQQPEARTLGTIERAVLRDGVVVSERVQSVTQASALEAVRGANDPYEYALHPQTRTPVAAHQLTGDSIVKIRGAEVTVDQAITMGWMANPFKQGGTQPTQGAQAAQGVAKEPEQQPVAEAIHPDLQREAVSRQGEETFAALTEFTGGSTRVAAMQELATTGEISEHRLGEIASQMGVEPSHVQGMVDQLRPAFEAQANSVAEAYGLEPEAVWEWAQEHCPDKAHAAVNRHLTLRNTHGYQDIVKSYVQNLDTIAPDTILGAEIVGGTVSRDGSGRIVLTYNDGRRMSWQQAIGMGLIKLESIR